MSIYHFTFIFFFFLVSLCIVFEKKMRAYEAQSFREMDIGKNTL